MHPDLNRNSLLDNLDLLKNPDTRLIFYYKEGQFFPLENFHSVRERALPQEHQIDVKDSSSILNPLYQHIIPKGPNLPVFPLYFISHGLVTYVQGVPGIMPRNHGRRLYLPVFSDEDKAVFPHNSVFDWTRPFPYGYALSPPAFPLPDKPVDIVEDEKKIINDKVELVVDKVTDEKGKSILKMVPRNRTLEK